MDLEYNEDDEEDDENDSNKDGNNSDKQGNGSDKVGESDDGSKFINLDFTIIGFILCFVIYQILLHLFLKFKFNDLYHT